MSFRQQAPASVLQALDAVHLPERTRAVEGTGEYLFDHTRQLCVTARAGNSRTPQMEVEVELLVIEQERVIEVEGQHRDLLPVPRQHIESRLDVVAQRSKALLRR